MISIKDLKKLAQYCYWHIEKKEYNEAKKRYGNPSSEEIVATALEGLKSKDRNIRVAMLWILKNEKTRQSTEGILLGLNDTKRRVRRTAIRASGNYLDDKRITDKLLAIIEDEKEGKNCHQAFAILTGERRDFFNEEIPEAAITYIKHLSQSDKYRDSILNRLCQAEKLTPEITELLKAYIKEGTKEQAILATKALCGYMIVHCKQEKEKFKNLCEPVGTSEVLYWVKRGFDEKNVFFNVTPDDYQMKTKSSEGKTIKLKKQKFFYFLTGAAASLIIASSTWFLLRDQNTEIERTYAFIDGKAVTDKHIAFLKAKSALLLISKNISRGTDCLDYLSEINKVQELVKSNKS